ncbi:MAG TPA: DUF3300 domain-containing protein [Acidobacteriaceae bacterium]|nr:DUF3300 domain-containing protein [Acidobacteriaceae bacterium]
MSIKNRNDHSLVASASLPAGSFRNIAHAAAQTLTQCLRIGTAVLLIAFMVPLGIVDAHAQVPAPQGSYQQLSNEQVNQLVAPIALYPDALVAQVLGAATYSPQVVEADRFVKEHAGIPPQQLAQMADTQPWDPGVKALVAFPTVLANMSRNLDWTRRLGNAYYNQPQDVMNAVQQMRQRAYAAGTLRTTAEQTVVYRPADIVIAPANPAVVYVPAYNPWAVYGAPVPVYPAYYYVAPPPRPGAVVAAAAVGFTIGVVVGAFAHYGWGWGHWGCGWGPHPVVAFNHVTYVSRSVTVINHGYYGRFDHSAEARSWNQHVAVGPRGGVYTDTRSMGNGEYSNTRSATGPRGANYTDTRTAGDGQYSNTRTATGPHGANYTDQRTAENGALSNTRTVTGPNGKTASSTTDRYAGGSTRTATGPNGKTATRTVSGRGTGDATITRSGPRGTRTRNRVRPH